MALNLRQRLCYRHTGDVWRASRIANSDGIGTPGEEVYTRVAAGVAYHHQTTPNMDLPTDVGRTVLPTLLTTDTAHFDAAENVRDGDLLLDQTTGDPLFGQVFRLLGPPRGIGNHGHRRANKQSFMCRLLERPPSAAFLPTGGFRLDFEFATNSFYWAVV